MCQGCEPGCFRNTLCSSAAAILYALAASTGALPAQSTDLIDSAQIGERGVVFEFPGQADGDGLYAATSAGDVDGDGFGDLLASTLWGVDGLPGITLIYGDGGLSGAHAVPDGVRAFTLRSRQPEASFAWEAIAPAGDLNQDGLADFLFGMSTYPDGDSRYRGRAFLVYGGPGASRPS